MSAHENPPASAHSRREFLARMSACMTLAAAAGCRRGQPPEDIVPWVDAPVGVTPGVSQRYATALTLAGFGTGVLVETREARPIRIEGNPAHPASLGAVDPRTQAEMLELYDTERSRRILRRGEEASAEELAREIREAVEPLRERRGKGLRILSGSTTSPTLGALMARLRERMPEVRWHRWEPVHRDGFRQGARLAFGEDVDVLWRFENAAVVLSLDAEPLSTAPGRLAHARAVARAHRPAELGGSRESMSRLYAVEATPTLFGANADHRLRLAPSRVRPFLEHVAAQLGVLDGDRDGPLLREHERHFAEVVARDLERHGPEALVIAGDTQPAEVHALAHAIVDRLGGFGTVAHGIEPVEVDPVLHGESVRELARDIDAGEVEALFVLGGNPALDGPSDLSLAERIAEVPFSLHLGFREDETSERCTWHVPLAHELETWSDCRAFDGTVTIQQPTIRNLFGGYAPIEVVAMLLGEEPATARRLVESHWRERLGDAFAETWPAALRSGIVPGTAARVRPVRLRESAATRGDGPVPDGLELTIRPHPALWDGRLANNPWLQELPDPFTKITWTDVALIAPATARRLGLENGDEVEIAAGGTSLRAPIHAIPAQAEDVLTVRLGYGGDRIGSTGAGRGVDAHRLRTTERQWLAAGVEITATGAHVDVPRTQHEARAEDPEPVVEVSLERLREAPESVADGHRHENPDVTFAKAIELDAPNQWGMAIDLTSCIGCNACVIACQSENNVPTVGPEQVAIGREMHWLRIDRYFTGEEDDPRIRFQPLACVHCESAPCEYVCPVGATVHSSDGLNQMVYNRCIGTRYCSNNCPYKVRRFNFLDYTGAEPIAREPSRNPDVTVRARGVMEKCTYCVQRINRARIHAKIEDRPLDGSDVVTACQSACPTEAIVFGDVSDPDSAVSRRKALPTDYLLLGHLNTRPRTSYGAVVRNANPELES